MATDGPNALPAVIYLPALPAMFHFAPLSGPELLAAAGAGLSLTVRPALLQLAQRRR
ncbi:hypothetical protein [Massilia frigida]|uniref:hypothetical protein n=1 Tax=Massilia frigida TaxID=2609281 RepID=UPI001420C69C|nr:hypothetical protein [Massilia frigida]